MALRKLTPETFLATAEMLQAHLRVKEADRWSPAVCRLKFHSFTSEFPEVSEAQFMWAAERWVQSTGAGFTRFPTWRELMASLYRCEDGLANRSWGFKEGLPPFLAPAGWQLEMLPPPRSLAAAPDPVNSRAYVPFTATEHPILPPSLSEAQGLTQEEWDAYLKQIDESNHNASGSQEDPGERIAQREMVGQRLQPTKHSRARAPEPRVPDRTPPIQGPAL